MGPADSEGEGLDPRIDPDAWACPTCRRALAPGEECPRCHQRGVLWMSLSGASLPAVPAHLRDAVDDEQAAEHADAHTSGQERSDEQPEDEGLREPPPVGGPLWFDGAGLDGGGLDAGG